jgi:RNA polymerase sigma-70 factor (ECF subfamily)
MRWRVRSIRHAADLPPDGEAVLRPLPGMGGMELASGGPGGSGIGRLGPGSDIGKPGRGPGVSNGSETAKKGHGNLSSLHLSAKNAGDRPQNQSNGNAPRNSPREVGHESGPVKARGAQPSSADRVPEDMATLVLDNSAMGGGPAPQPEARPVSAGAANANAVSDAAKDPTSDAAIMLRVAAGDEAGFNYLAQKYHRAMIHFLFRMVHNEAVAEELAQEVFLRVYRSRESYRAEAKFTTWLYRIATNLAVNHARDTKHERSAQTIYLDAPDEESGARPDVADDEPSVEQRLIRDERMAAIRIHVMALPERQRMAVLMHKYQGMDYRQIGDVLKLSESATKSLLFRAYQTLRDKLKEFV